MDNQKTIWFWLMIFIYQEHRLVELLELLLREVIVLILHQLVSWMNILTNLQFWLLGKAIIFRANDVFGDCLVRLFPSKHKISNLKNFNLYSRRIWATFGIMKILISTPQNLKKILLIIVYTHWRHFLSLNLNIFAWSLKVHADSILKKERIICWSTFWLKPNRFWLKLYQIMTKHISSGICVTITANFCRFSLKISTNSTTLSTISHISFRRINMPIKNRVLRRQQTGCNKL